MSARGAAVRHAVELSAELAAEQRPKSSPRPKREDTNGTPEWFRDADSRELRDAFERLGALSRSAMGDAWDRACLRRSMLAHCPRCKGTGRIWSSPKVRAEAEKADRRLRLDTVAAEQARERLRAEIADRDPDPVEMRARVYAYWESPEPDLQCPRCAGEKVVIRPIRNSPKGGLQARPSGGSMHGASGVGPDPKTVTGLGETLHRLRQVERVALVAAEVRSAMAVDLLRCQLPGEVRPCLECPPDHQHYLFEPGAVVECRRPGVLLAACLEAWFSPGGECLEALWAATGAGRAVLAGVDPSATNLRATALTRPDGTKSVGQADRQARTLLEAALRAWVATGEQPKPEREVVSAVDELRGCQ